MHDKTEPMRSRITPRRTSARLVTALAACLALAPVGLSRAAGNASEHKAAPQTKPGETKGAQAHDGQPAQAKADATAGHGRKPARTDSHASDDAQLEHLRQRLVDKLDATKVPHATTPSVRVTAKAAAPSSTGHGSAHAAVSVPSQAHARAQAHAPAHRPAAPAHGGGHAHWSYHGESGPDAWGRMQPEFSTCAIGQRQSPIDIRGGIRVDLEPVQFDYRAGRFAVIDNGHTVQVNVEAGNSIAAMGRRYELVQFHFHRPSEERIDGRQFDMVAHLVHKDADGRLAVVAVLLDRGSAHPLVQTVWNNLPLEKGDEVRAGGTLDLAQLLPQDRRYHTYMGSLTTPPCSEGVMWIVMAQPVAISSDQIAVFSHLYPMNARPVQPPSGRLVKSSN